MTGYTTYLLKKEAKSLKTIVIDRKFEEMLISAVRYALGKKAYIVDDTVNYVMAILPYLSDRCKRTIERDVDNFLRGLSEIQFFAGDVMEENSYKIWSALLDAIQIERRTV